MHRYDQLVLAAVIALGLTASPAAAQYNTTVPYTYTGKPFSLSQCQAQPGYVPGTCQSGSLTVVFNFDPSATTFTGTATTALDFSAGPAVVSVSASALGTTLASPKYRIGTSTFVFMNGQITAGGFEILDSTPSSTDPASADQILGGCAVGLTMCEDLALYFSTGTPGYIIGLNMDSPGIWSNGTPPALPAITSSGIVSGASFQTGIAANSWITIAGTNLSPVTDNWSNAITNGNLPVSLDGVTVSVGGQPAYVNYVSPTQINAVAPNVGAGPVSVTVTTPNGVSSAATTVAEALQPAFFQWGSYAVATHQDYSLAVKNGTFAGLTTVPAKPGDVIILWGTGFGPTNPSAPVGVEVPSDTTYYTASGVQVMIGNAPATVYGAALAPGYAALYQVAIQIPASLANGDYPVVASISGAQSPASTLITVQQ